MIDRPRLIARLRTRFDVPLLSVVAGAGFGKSVLLRQALADNLHSPRGTDCWVGLSLADARASSLVDSIGRAAGLTVATLEGAELGPLLVDHLGAGTCLVFDDVHLLVDGTPGAEVLEQLCSSLPPGLTALLSGRALPVALGRLRDLGEMESLDEGELAFTADEVGEVVGTAEIEDLGGWPAMVSLQRRLGRAGARRFVLDELLAALDPDDREALAVLSQLGPLDRGMASVALDRPVDTAAFAELPLVLGGRDRIEPHSLWSDLLAGSVEEQVVIDAWRRVAEQLLSDGDVVRGGRRLRAPG